MSARPHPARATQRLRRAGAAGGLLVAAAIALTLGLGASSPQDQDVKFAVGEGSDKWPSDTLSDWASYADQLSVIVVEDERALAPPPPEISGGYIERRVTLRVDQTLWRRSHAPTVTGRFEMRDYGWLERGAGSRRPVTTVGGVRLAVGERYLAPLVRTDEGAWTVLTPSSAVTLAGDSATSRVDVGSPSPALLALKDHHLGEVPALFHAAKPDPLAVKYAALPPRARFEAVSRERAAQPNSP